MRAKDAVGRYGEQVAARYLQSMGLTLLDRNWRCPEGEIDIVAREDELVVICEVKTRRGLDFGPPVEAVTPAKARRLRTLGLRWLADHDHPYVSLRFDVVSVVAQPRGAAAVEHLRGAF
ncbi:MAG: YraN family protein [Frankiaceae bacterium]|jgi:putative endonuclease